ncbi:MAG: hypothetical protein QOJ35_3243 [Solirubrobacteraceae bacterium]|nr:hypothetical protein [Solirubrobacteraceae bacterium]
MRPPPAYPGLASYGDSDDDADLFFGRTRERELLIANLRAARTTVVYGPSGVGKSSLLHAGVVHRLREEADDDDDEPRTAVVILDDWTGDPEQRLAAQIRALTSDDGAGSPVAAVAAYRRHRSGGLLLILDQFEEYLRFHPGPSEPRFDATLSELVGDRRLSVRVLIAIREDRLADLDRLAGRLPNLFGNTLRLGALTPAAALQAIEGPIERYAAWARAGRVTREVTLEDGLGEAVRDELVALTERRQNASASGRPPRHEPGVEASFLQIVMRRLWDEDTAAGGTTLQLATYARLGGAGEIVATHLDAALASLSAHDQAVADEILRFLVTPSGATACLTARDLSEYTDRPEAEVEALAEKLSRPPARILRGVAATTGEVTAGGYELPQVLAEPAVEWRARRRTARLEERARRLLLALVAMTSVALALVGYALDPEPLQRLELASVDARFDVRGARGADPRIALVTIDDATNARLDAGPTPARAVTARVLDAIAATDPRAVVVDIRYNRPKDPTADRMLIAAIHGPLSARLVLATDRLNGAGQSQLFGSEEQTFDDRSAPAVGYAGFPADPGNVARRVARTVTLPSGAEGLDTLGVVAARIAGAIRPQQLPSEAWIAFRGGNGTFARIRFDDVLQRRPEALAKLHGKIVVLGNTAKVVGDVHRTSAPGPSPMDGAEIQANAISTALDRFPLRGVGRTLDLLLIIALGLVPLALALRSKVVLVLPAALIVAALFCAVAQLAFVQGRVVPVVYPLLSLALATVGVTAVAVSRGRADARRARDARAR